MSRDTSRLTRAVMATLIAAISTSVTAGSNLPGGVYPDAVCGERPEVPERPEKFETEEAIAEYNAKVDAYNAGMERLVECVREYVRNAAEDIEQIRRRSQEAIDRLNQ